MEHRLHRRESVDFMVRLVSGGEVVATARAVDMSPGGLGIEPPDVPLHAGQGLGIDFCKPGYPRGVSCFRSAMVIYLGDQTTGLMFAGEGDLPSVMKGYDAGSVCSYK